MGEHLTAELIGGYRARTLAPEQLLTVSGHLAACGECRAKVARPSEQGKLVEALGGEHLPYEALEALVNGASAGRDHLAGCATCAAELADLQAFQTDLVRAKKRSSPGARIWSGVRILVPAFAVAALVLLAVRLHSVPSAGKAPAIAASQSPLVASLRDGTRVIALASDGTLRGLDSASPQARAEVAEVLRSGRIPGPAADSGLVRPREILLGEGAKSAVIEPVLEPVMPVGTGVASDRPVFRWSAPVTARGFRVAIYDSRFELVRTSPLLDGREWTPAKPLAREQTYTWTVSGRAGGTRVTAPHAPEPEARFHVASAQVARQVDDIRNGEPGSDLMVAIMAARFDLRDEAGAALGRLEQANPGSALVARLRDSLRHASR